jgi:HEAT repeat protein
MDPMRARWLIALLAAMGTVATAQEEGKGAAGKGEDPTAALVESLKSPDARMREKAARTIGRDHHQPALDAVRRLLLDDPDANVRAAAAVALVRLDAPDKRVEEALVEALESPNWYTRWEACVALGGIGPAAWDAVPALLSAAADKESDLAPEAVVAVLRISPRDPQALSGLASLLDTAVTLDRKEVLKALDDAGQIELALDWLVKEVISDRHGLRKRATDLLAEDHMAGIAEALRGGDTYARLMALDRLERNEKVGIDVFVAALADPDPLLRRTAMGGLKRRKAAKAAPAIAELLADEDWWVRSDAVQALGELKTPVPGAAPALVRIAAEGEKDAAEAALSALAATGHPELAACLECGIRVDPGPGKSRYVVRLLPSAKGDEAIGQVLADLDDNTYGAMLVTALREFLADDEDQVLLAALDSADADARRVSAALLGHLARDPTAAIHALEAKARRDPDPKVRAAAAAAIARLRP